MQFQGLKPKLLGAMLKPFKILSLAQTSLSCHFSTICLCLQKNQSFYLEARRQSVGRLLSQGVPGSDVHGKSSLERTQDPSLG